MVAVRESSLEAKGRVRAGSVEERSNKEQERMQGVSWCEQAPKSLTSEAVVSKEENIGDSAAWQKYACNFNVRFMFILYANKPRKAKWMLDLHVMSAPAREKEAIRQHGRQLSGAFSEYSC
ncbi:hypothetical protein NDU88_001799 [Pleurodeles waltl]|uniref:Uncharacterized protein n=1 Tax=Pleurodeles waltl TaxID=8319 RepID=A0AAV7R895_PLEWA|nr:hypothetical protein NDU88_001799 [Pleurodeles waltl]